MTGGRPRSSFRDPAGTLVQDGGRVLRLVHDAALTDLETLEASSFVRRAQAAFRLIPHTRLEPGALPSNHDPDAGAWLEHPRIPFPSFPEEWCWGMLRDAALLSLDLALEAEAEGLELKDASPRNILFRGCSPCFVDLLSFRRPLPEATGWLPLTSFLREFLFPLALTSRFGLRPERFFLADRSGISHAETEQLIGFMGSFKAPFWRWLRLPKLLAPLAKSLPQAEGMGITQPEGFLRALLAGLRRDVASLRVHPEVSEWSSYEQDRTYTEAALALKRDEVRSVLQTVAPGSWVLDLGTNAGEFSLMAARMGLDTVALDRDPACVQRLFERAKAEQLPILPLVMDLSRPTPPTGWANAEQAGFCERAEGRFQLVLALALVHHLRFPAGIPLRLQMAQLARYTRQLALVEWIPETDPQVAEFIARYHYHPTDYRVEGFEAACTEHFQILSRTPLRDTDRTLYLLEKRP